MGCGSRASSIGCPVGPTTDGALVGSVTGSHLRFLPLLPEGNHRVRVYTDPVGQQAVGATSSPRLRLNSYAN
jgi:hypothetical protein